MSSYIALRLAASASFAPSASEKLVELRIAVARRIDEVRALADLIGAVVTMNAQHRIGELVEVVDVQREVVVGVDRFSQVGTSS